MSEWTRDRYCVTMDDTPHIQKLKQKIAEKKRVNEQSKEPEGTQGEQIDFYKFMDKESK